MKIHWIDECGSTNSESPKYFSPDELVFVATRSQTAGRGQKGNHWEAEPGKNLTFSAVWQQSDFLARNQFSISEAVALAVVDLLNAHDLEAQVKWPNDIYIGDKKICGILIEHSVTGMNLDRTIAGIGINVNQSEFRSDAPNPVSMMQLAATEFPLESLLEEYGGFLESRLAQISSGEGMYALHEEFKDNMWRFDGNDYHFFDKGTQSEYLGRIVDVEHSGMLLVEDSASGERYKYAFKEVEFLLS